MRLLLDENFPQGAVLGLEGAGHDVQAVSSLAPGTDDRAVLSLARKESRILLTFDADFGDLIFQRGEPPPPAVVFFRLHPIVVAEVLAIALAALQPAMEGCFVVATRESVRRRRFDGEAGDGGS